MSSLIVFLATSSPSMGAEYDYVLTHDGRSVAAHGRCAPDLLPRVGEVVAVLATTTLSWHPVRLPKGALSARAARHTPRLRAALESLLEDNLLDDAAQLHLALAPQPMADGRWLVAACGKAALQAHLLALERGGRAVARIVPELEPAPAQWVALEQGGQARLATLTPLAVLNWPLSATGARLAGATPATQDVPLLAEPGCTSAAEAACQRTAELLGREQRWLRSASSPWDLAQFDLRSTGQARRLKRLHQAWHTLAHAPAWRAVRWGVVALVVVQLAGLNAWAWHERRALGELRAGMLRTLTQTFPGVRTVVDAPLQMGRELEALRRASGATQATDLESLLGALATAVPTGRSASALDYASGTLRVKGLRLSDQEWVAAQQRLREHALQARQEGADVVVGGGAP